MKRWFVFAAFVAVLPVIALACGDDDTNGVTADGGPAPTTTTTATSTATTTPLVDAGPDAARRKGCLDHPTNLDRPNQLSCELISPGLTL